MSTLVIAIIAVVGAVLPAGIAAAYGSHRELERIAKEVAIIKSLADQPEVKEKMLDSLNVSVKRYSYLNAEYGNRALLWMSFFICCGILITLLGYAGYLAKDHLGLAEIVLGVGALVFAGAAILYRRLHHRG